MGNSRIHALFQDGPRAGQVAVIDPGPDGRPPHEVVLDDPLGAGGRDEESFDIEPTPTYHQHGHGKDRETYRYGIDRPEEG